MPKTVVSLSNVSLTYNNDVRALRDVTLGVAEGERLCVLGSNGSGKSTLASVICGLLAPDEGSVELAGERVVADGEVDFDAYARARRSLGLVFQNPDDQIVTTVVEEDVAFGPENLGLASDEIGHRVERELRRVAMQDFAKANPTRLSGGQKQRVAIAGALALEPKVLVLDEPGALLDVRGRRSILHVMGRLHEMGVTLVHVTHFMEEAFEADRVIVMNAGSIMLEGTPDEVFSHEEELRSLGLEAPFAARIADELAAFRVGVTPTCDSEALARELAGLAATAKIDAVGDSLARGGATVRTGGARKRGKRDTGGAMAVETPALSCEGVSFSYSEGGPDARKALDNVSFSVAQGSTCAIVGHTGSGKSTLVRLLCMLDDPDAGRISVGGKAVSNKRERKRMRGAVGYVMQHPERQLFGETVVQDVSYGPRNMGLSPEDVDAYCQKALSLVGLEGKDDVSPFELSGGQQRLCALAGVLAMRPDVLVLDEPMAGLDPAGRSKLAAVLDDLNDHGVTIIQVTHSMAEAARCDQVIALCDGHVLVQGTAAEVFCPGMRETLEQSGLGLPPSLGFAQRVEGIAREDGSIVSIGSPLTEKTLVGSLVQAILPDAPTPRRMR